jgi:hypothetical protein
MNNILKQKIGQEVPQHNQCKKRWMNGFILSKAHYNGNWKSRKAEMQKVIFTLKKTINHRVSSQEECSIMLIESKPQSTIERSNLKSQNRLKSNNIN